MLQKEWQDLYINEVPGAERLTTSMELQHAAARQSAQFQECIDQVATHRIPRLLEKSGAFSPHLPPTKHVEWNSHGMMEHKPEFKSSKLYLASL